jgi:PAS domain S-box-containing protein
MFEPCEEDKRLIEIVSTVATQLGSLLQRKRAEEAQQESNNRLYAVLDNSTAIIYVKDAYGKYLLINHCFTNLFGFELEELKSKTDHDIFPHDLADTYRANDQKVLEAGTAIESEEVVFHEDGLHTYLSLKFPLYNAAELSMEFVVFLPISLSASGRRGTAL